MTTRPERRLCLGCGQALRPLLGQVRRPVPVARPPLADAPRLTGGGLRPR